MFKERLYKETKTLKYKFSDLMFCLQKHLEQRLVVDDVVIILESCDNNFKGVLNDCKSFTAVFRKVIQFVSFVDYDLLEHLIDTYGSDELKQKLKEYNNLFQEFAKRRVVECPSNAFSDSDCESAGKVYVMVADKNIEDLTLDELKKFNFRLQTIMDGKLVKLLRVKGGSIYLTFCTFENKIAISEEQRQALWKEGVISIMFGDQHFDIRPSQVPSMLIK